MEEANLCSLQVKLPDTSDDLIQMELCIIQVDRLLKELVTILLKKQIKIRHTVNFPRPVKPLRLDRYVLQKHPLKDVMVYHEQHIWVRLNSHQRRRVNVPRVITSIHNWYEEKNDKKTG